jgi:enamine deaminase RidA (YjgF/YER057c/UK114 family)
MAYSPSPALLTQASLLPKPTFVSRSIAHRGWSKQPTTLSYSTPDEAWSQQLELFLKGDHTAILGVTLFGDEPDLAAMKRELRRRGVDAPQTAIISNTSAPGGIQLDAFTGANLTPLFDGDRLIGTFFEDCDAKYCILGSLTPATPAAPRTAQTEALFHSIQRTLACVGMHFRDVVRTWFYADHILDWYPCFNEARTSFFRELGITRMPASTGVGGSNLAGTALAARVIAVQPKTQAITIREAGSPLQCEALAYGSTFSRAMEVADSHQRSLYVSGTASIEPGGKTAHCGNPAMQIEKTMEVVGAILEQSAMGLENVTRAIAYFRHGEHAFLWDEYCRARQLPPLPIIVTQCDICRDDLLFELELDAVRAR